MLILCVRSFMLPYSLTLPLSPDILDRTVAVSWTMPSGVWVGILAKAENMDMFSAVLHQSPAIYQGRYSDEVASVARLRNELPIPKPDIPTLTANRKVRTLKHEVHGWWEVAFKTVICVCKELSSRTTTTWQIQGWSGVTPKSSLKSLF